MEQNQTGGQQEVGRAELSGVLRHSGREALRYAITYPRIEARTSVEQRINRYHHNQAVSFERLIKNQHMPTARAQLKAFAGHDGFEPLEITAGFQLMYTSPRLLSVFTDTFFQLRHQGTRLARSSRTYDMETGRVLLLPQLFVRGSLFRQIIWRSITAQIEQEAEKHPGCYFSHWRQLCRPAMGDGSFYLTDDGIVMYFQENTIAGKNAGLPAFRVPYSLFEGQLQFGLQ